MRSPSTATKGELPLAAARERVHSNKDPEQPKTKNFFECCLSLLLNFSAPLPAFRGRQCRHVPLAGPLEAGQGLVTLISVTLDPARAGPDTQDMSKRVGDSEGPWPEPCPAAPCPALAWSRAGGSQPVSLTASSLSPTSPSISSGPSSASASPHFGVPLSSLSLSCVSVSSSSPVSQSVSGSLSVLGISSGRLFSFASVCFSMRLFLRLSVSLSQSLFLAVSLWLCPWHTLHTHRPMWDTFMRRSGTSSFPFFSHTPRTFSSDTSHLNTAWSFEPTVKSAMLWYTSSFFSAGAGQTQ